MVVKQTSDKEFVSKIFRELSKSIKGKTFKVSKISEQILHQRSPRDGKYT